MVPCLPTKSSIGGPCCLGAYALFHMTLPLLLSRGVNSFNEVSRLRWSRVGPLLDCWASNPSSASSWLCGFGQVLSLFLLCFSSSINGDNNSLKTLGVTMRLLYVKPLGTCLIRTDA